MGILLPILVVGVLLASVFAVGRATADRGIKDNHHKLAMFAITLRHKDDTVPFLSSDDRKRLDGLVNDYTHLKFIAELESGRSRLRCLAAVFVVAGLLLAACGGSPTLDEGQVVQKIYDDEDEWYQPPTHIPGSCSGGYNGQPRVCSPDVVIPGMWHTDPERYLLKLEGPDPDNIDKTITDTRNVPESFWNDVRVGQWVDIDLMEVIEK